jgi:hypothetical protein
MPTSVIAAVEALADRDKQEGNMEFTDRDGHTYDNLHDTNQQIDGVAGVDIVDETTQNEQEQEHEEEMTEIPGVPETTTEDVEFPIAEPDIEIPGVEPLDNPEIPGVEPIGNSEIPGVPIGNPEIPGVDAEEIPGVDNKVIEPDNMEMNLEAPEMEEAPEEITTTEVITGHPPVQSGEDGDNEHDSSGPPPPLSPRSDYTSDSDDEDDEPDEEIPDDEVYHPDTMAPSVQSTYGLRPKRARDYIHLHANVVHHAMTQYSLNKGLRKFREKGEKTVEKELGQLHMKETFSPVQVKDLSPVQKKGALESLVFLKEKRDGSIKGRACADGRKQREGSNNSDAISPTVALESVIITATVDAFERREVAIVDVPGVF